MRKTTIFLFTWMLILTFVCRGATLEGTIYTFDLEKAENAIVGIDTNPMQTFVAVNGTYKFNVPTGYYTIAAVYSNGEKLKTSQKIVIEQEGEFVLDLILFPDLGEEDDLLDITEVELKDPYDGGSDTLLIVVIVSLVVIAAIVVGSFITKKPSKVEVVSKDEDEAEAVIDFIKEQGGRTTQKDIRKKFPSSEAKISLVISELESKGRLEKIKKGRGNIIRLK